MDIDKNGRTQADEEDERPDPETLSRVKDILTLFAHTISSMKLFPPHHSSVLSFQDELFHKIQNFLEEHWELEVHIEENAFRYKGELVFKDEDVLKSLPYVFFKDGLYELAFLRDMEKDEFATFLDTIKNVASLPPDEGDTVDALWEKDLVHLRYYAPDEFLESKLRVQRQNLLDLHIDKDLLFKGKIELTREDLEDISKRLVVFRQKENKEARDFVGLAAFLDKGDLSAIETMLDSDRDASSDKGLSELIFELLYMEDRVETFKMILTFLDKRYGELVAKAGFADALQMMRQMTDLSQALSDKSPARALEIDKFIRASKSQVSLDILRDQVRRGAILDSRAFFDFLLWLGPVTLPIGVEILESDLEPGVRSNAFDFLAEAGKENLALLANLAQERKPFVTKTIIAVLDHMNDKRVIPFLAPFINYRNRDVKAEAIRVLGRFPDSLAQKILLGFLRDEDEEIRVAAAKSIRMEADKDLAASVAQWVSDKDFHDRTPQEKEVALSALGQIRPDEAFECFRSFLGQKGIWGKGKAEETGILAASALEAMATPRAVEVLRQAEKSSGRKKIKEACREALVRLAAGPQRS